MTLIKTCVVIAGAALLVTGCNKTQTSNTVTENTTVSENSAATENAAAENTTTENVATDNNEVAPSNAIGNRTKDDPGIRH